MVLTPGGRLGFTVWYGPDKGNDFFRMLLSTYQAYGVMDVVMPLSPPLFALSDPSVHVPMLQQACFEEVTARDLAIAWPLRGPETEFEFAMRGAVRIRTLYERQKPDVQRRIREAPVEAVSPYLRAGAHRIPCPAVLVMGRMPR